MKSGTRWLNLCTMIIFLIPTTASKHKETFLKSWCLLRPGNGRGEIHHVSNHHYLTRM